MTNTTDDSQNDPAAVRAAARRPLVLHITNIPTPYRLPYYRAVAAALDTAGIDLRVHFLGKGKRKREWTIDAGDLRGFAHTLGDPSDPFRAAADAIRREKPAVVVLAWAMDPLALRLLLFCRRRGIPIILFTGETAATAAGRTYPWLRALVRRPFFSLANGFLTYGTRSTEYLIGNGVRREKIDTGINVVDTEFFRHGVDRLRASGEASRERERWRDGRGGAFAAHLLLVGYMIPGKGVGATIEALAALGRRDIALHIVGSGPREEAHRTHVKERGLDDIVFFHGYRQTPEMPSFYAFADVVLFPSFIDVFGLVMSEGAAAGLPVIASPYSGGTVDVVEDGVTGIVVDPNDAARYAAAIARLADDPGLRRAMGAAGRDRAMRLLTPEVSAGRYLAAIERIVRGR
jgi:glycosyltransferase involved in cell wall biosynthesis